MDNSDAAIEAIMKAFGDNLERAAVHLVTKIKEALNTDEPYAIYGQSGRYYRGLDPSQPGDSPKKIRGDLQRSVTFEMNEDRTEARVGTNIPYAKSLELGTSKMAARPFLQTTLNQEQAEIDRILRSGFDS